MDPNFAGQGPWSSTYFEDWYILYLSQINMLGYFSSSSMQCLDSQGHIC